MGARQQFTQVATSSLDAAMTAACLNWIFETRLMRNHGALCLNQFMNIYQKSRLTCTTAMARLLYSFSENIVSRQNVGYNKETHWDRCFLL